MDDDFDSGDDLFDGVTAEELINEPQSSKRNMQDEDLSRSTSSKKPRLSAPSTEPPIVSGDPGKLQLARNILMQKFGYPAFRHEQEGAISKVLDGQSSLVIFPTGAGKSLCYQVSASSLSHGEPPADTRAADPGHRFRGAG